MKGICNRISILLVIILFVTAGFVDTAKAQESDLDFAGFGTAIIDGVMSEGEWDGADRMDYEFNLPVRNGGGTTPATLYIMNDDTHLYFAFKIEIESLDYTIATSFMFDSDLDGDFREIGEDIQVINIASYPVVNFADDFRSNLPSCPVETCGFSDTDDGGTEDGIGAFTNDSMYTILEFSRPLNSGDIGHDFSLDYGDQLGFYQSSTIFSPYACGSDCIAHTTHFWYQNAVITIVPPNGFITGLGTIYSPPGAYTPNPEMHGEANFAFVSRYLTGATTPSGKTQFIFSTAGMKFYSDSYEKLVVAGAKAIFKGTGTINGTGDYGFMISAIDEKFTPKTDVDLFRIKIWDKETDTVIYDNQLGATEGADPTSAITSGKIVIHK